MNKKENNNNLSNSTVRKDLIIETLIQGSGDETARSGDNVSVHYTRWLENGKNLIQTLIEELSFHLCSEWGR